MAARFDDLAWFSEEFELIKTITLGHSMRALFTNALL
jgi:hypothetical protein